jgi:hypothetical protein
VNDLTKAIKKIMVTMSKEITETLTIVIILLAFGPTFNVIINRIIENIIIVKPYEIPTVLKKLSRVGMLKLKQISVVSSGKI